MRLKLLFIRGKFGVCVLKKLFLKIKSVKLARAAKGRLSSRQHLPMCPPLRSLRRATWLRSVTNFRLSATVGGNAACATCPTRVTVNAV